MVKSIDNPACNNLELIERIIYPYYNGTAVWYKKNRYDIVVGDTTYYIYDWNVIRLLEILLKLNKIEVKYNEEQ